MMEQIREISFADIELNMSDIYLMMGSADYVPDQDMRKCVEQMIAQAALICKPRFAYKLYPSEGTDNRKIYLAERHLTTGGIIAPFFKDAQYHALFIATSGIEFQQWLEQIRSQGDIMREFIADAIGSEIAEATARHAAQELNKECAARQMKIGNSYSPGYCGWNITDQHILFSLMPKGVCGVKLSASSLMYPIKSVSGAIAVGSAVEKMPYGCTICGKKDCYKKLATSLE